MKKQLILACLVIVSLMIASCSLFCKRSNPATLSQALLSDVKWQLVELDGKPVASKINGKTPFIQFNKEDSSYAASGGCNGMGGQYELKSNDKIVFKRGMSTMMYCEDMTVEHGLGKIFNQTVNYTIENKTLLFHQSGKTVAKFVIDVDNSTSLNGDWVLDYVGIAGQTTESLFPQTRPTLRLDLKDGKFSGNGGCNNYFGSFTVIDNTVNFGAIGATRKFCAGVGESTYFDTLSKVVTYSIVGNTLTFTVDKDTFLRYNKK